MSDQDQHVVAIGAPDELTWAYADPTRAAALRHWPTAREIFVGDYATPGVTWDPASADLQALGIALAHFDASSGSVLLVRAAQAAVEPAP